MKGFLHAQPLLCLPGLEETPQESVLGSEEMAARRCHMVFQAPRSALTIMQWSN